MTRLPIARAAVVLSLVLASFAHASAQNNVIDVRPSDINSDGTYVYQTLVVSRLFAGGKVLAEGVYVGIPGDGVAYPDYKELSVGAGYRVFNQGGVQVYAMAHVAKATDVNWFQPATTIMFANGRWAGFTFFQRYWSLTKNSPSAWLLDPAEIQYRVAGPVSLGVSAYVFAYDDSDALRKFGPKISVADKWGATELRSARVDQPAKWEFQLRRLIIF